jgi:hypothetical protein
MATVKRKVVRSYSAEEDGNQFPLALPPVDDTVEIRVVGDKAYAAYLVEDEVMEDWFFDERDEGDYYGYDRRAKGFNPLDSEGIQALIESNRGRVFWINKYEHSLVKYYRASDALTLEDFTEYPDTAPRVSRMIIPDQQWDVSPGAALYVAPSDCPDPAKYCDSVMEEFTNWCNGWIYGVCVETFERSGDEWVQVDEDSCYGYLGYDYAISVRDEELAGAMK